MLNELSHILVGSAACFSLQMLYSCLEPSVGKKKKKKVFSKTPLGSIFRKINKCKLNYSNKIVKDGVWLILHEIHVQEEKKNKILQGCAFVSLGPNKHAVRIYACCSMILEVNPAQQVYTLTFCFNTLHRHTMPMKVRKFPFAFSYMWFICTWRCFGMRPRWMSEDLIRAFQTQLTVVNFHHLWGVAAIPSSVQGYLCT